MLPLTTADLLAHAIVGLVLENLDMERLVREVGQAVAQRILGNNESVDDVARELHEKLLLRNESTKKVVIESIYKDSEEARHNVEIFSLASNLAEARPHLRRVRFLQDCSLILSNQQTKLYVYSIFVDQRDPLHGQVHASADAQRTGCTWLPTVFSAAPIRFEIAALEQLHRVVAAPQGRHGLCGIRRGKVVQCLWYGRPVDPVLPGGQQGGIWERTDEHPEQRIR
jgi:hypothetical protein